MNWQEWRDRIFGDPDAVDAYRDAKAALNAYGWHRAETHPRTAYETLESERLTQRVIEAEKNIPPWRFGYFTYPSDHSPPERRETERERER